MDTCILYNIEPETYKTEYRNETQYRKLIFVLKILFYLFSLHFFSNFLNENQRNQEGNSEVLFNDIFLRNCTIVYTKYLRH